MDISKLPAQIGALSLGTTGLCNLYCQWIRIFGLDHPVISYVGRVPIILKYVTFMLMSTYAMKMVLAPSSFRDDVTNPGTIPSLNALLSAIQQMACRFCPAGFAQCVVVECWFAHALLAILFLFSCYRKGIYPDPSWYPGVLLIGTCNFTSYTVGPDFLKKYMTGQLVFLIVIMLLIHIMVTYRLFLSPTRDSVAPNAGMAALVAPCSFYTMVYLAVGKPFGDVPGLLLFALSTTYLFLTLGLLYARRGIWTSEFHPSYVALTFPFGSTVTAALLSFERLPAVRSNLLLAWVSILTLCVTIVITLVVIDFIYFSLKEVNLVEKPNPDSNSKSLDSKRKRNGATGTTKRSSRRAKKHDY